MDFRRALREAWRQTGIALVGPFILVAVSGIIVLFGYNSNPDVASQRIASAPTWFGAARSIHHWSSNALLAGGFLHVAWTWNVRRVAGPQRPAYLLGTVFLGLVALEHLTGHVLRWDAAANRLADYERTLVPFDAAAAQLPLHVGLFGLAALVVGFIHVGLGVRGARRDVDAEVSPWMRRAAIPSIIASALILALAWLVPAPEPTARLPWPMGFFADIATVLGQGAFFVLAAVGAWLLVAVQPWLVGRPLAARSVQILAGVVFVASLFRV